MLVHSSARYEVHRVLPATTTLGSFVRERRQARGWSQRQLAEIAGVGLNFVSALETGRPGLRVDGVERVLATFGKRLGIEDLPRHDEGR
jgi:y4mF family transcriptional regulator